MTHSSLRRLTFATLLYVMVAGISACNTAPAAQSTTVPAQTQAAPAVSTAASTVAPTGQGKVLTIGEISNNPAETLTLFQPLADYLGARLGKYGYSSVVIKAAPDLDTMVTWLKNGDLDMTFDSAYPALIMADRAGAKPILRRWKGGVEQYHTMIFVRTDSKITSLTGLKGKMIAFEESFSTSGYMLPKAYLVEAGYTVIEEKDSQDKVGENEIGYIFTNGDDPAASIIQWVVSGKTAAGAVNNKDFDDIPEDTKKLLSVLGETESLPRHLVLVRGTLDPAVSAGIKTILLEMTTPEAADVLKSFGKTAKFDEFPQGPDQAIARMRVLYNLAQGQIG